MSPASLTMLAQNVLFAQNVSGEEAAVGVAVVLYMLCIGISMILGVLSLILWVWMLVDCIQNEPNSPDNQFVIWLLVILLAGGLGAIIYYFVRYRPRKNNPHPYVGPMTPPYGQQPPGKF
jgi:prolipoprotein diacylglyceryltransferase